MPCNAVLEAFLDFKVRGWQTAVVATEPFLSVLQVQFTAAMLLSPHSDRIATKDESASHFRHAK